MTDYASSDLALFYGSSSATNDAQTSRTFSSVPASPTQYVYAKISAITTSTGTFVDFSDDLTAVAELYVWNRDTTNYVTLDYKTASASSTQAEKIPAGQWVKLTDVKVSYSLNVLAHTAACVCEIWVVGT